MSRFRRPQGRTIWPMLMAMLIVMSGLLWTAGCARPQSNDSVVHADQPPFHDSESTASAPQGSPAAQNAGPNLGSNSGSELGSNPDTGLPFQDPKNLPAGTLLTVRLKNSITAENPGANRTFEAVVDEPVVIEGNRLVPRGAVVSGRVESARASKVKRNRGYVRLVLNSIHLAGMSLPIQTSSLFVRGNASDVQSGETTHGETSQGEAAQSEASAAVIRLEKGRRLTFRLTEPAYVAASQRTPVAH
jgi:hypothetical protein